ncbi:MAG: ribonuclease E/G [Pseudomonadota bacterium]
MDWPDGQPARAALIVEGRLEDLVFDPPAGQHVPMPGQIYWAKIDRLVPKMGGAFVKLDARNHGFLRETQGVKPGQGLLVQVTAHPEAGKAAPVTSRILYKGRLVIHLPGSPGTNVSRQIKDPEERARLQAAIASWAPDPDAARGPALNWYREIHDAGGFIVRSAARSANVATLHDDVSRVLASRSEMEGLTRGAAPGGTTHGASTAIDFALREWTTPAVRQITAGREAARYVRAVGHVPVAGDPESTVALVDQEGDVFDVLGIWDQADALKSPRVDLASGGWMAIEPTLAMVTIDVNTGDGFGAADALTTCLEAVRELPRQLRLRGLGGQMIIDFAPIKKTNRRQIEEAMKTAFRRDPVDTTLAGWTPLGNFELHRKRERLPLDLAL